MMPEVTPCALCAGTGIDSEHNWKDGDIVSSRLDVQAACERCEGSGEEPTSEQLELTRLWKENDVRLND